jgi:hypothetical protein
VVRLVASGISDTGKRISVHVRELGQAAARAADLAVFIGEHAQPAARAAVRSGMAPGAVVGFADLQRAAAYLKSELRRGDLVLLKGRTTDHLERVLFAQVGAVRCRRATCSKTIACDLCPSSRATPGPRTNVDRFMFRTYICREAGISALLTEDRDFDRFTGFSTICL